MTLDKNQLSSLVPLGVSKETSIQTYDFYTLYTSMPADLLRSSINNIINNVFRQKLLSSLDHMGSIKQLNLKKIDFSTLYTSIRDNSLQFPTNNIINNAFRRKSPIITGSLGSP